jgi:hypothetical protein
VKGLVLTGLDGSNPLGFLAALGVLNVLADRDGGSTLQWRLGDWRPIVADATVLDADALVGLLRADLATWADDPCLELRYAKGSKTSEKSALKSRQAWDLKPPPSEFRAYLERMVETAGAEHRRSVDFAAAFATQTAQDNNGNTKPTALHFTAGQQQFLEMVVQLRDAVTEHDLREAVVGPWRYQRVLPVLGWDCTAARAWSLRADDPSKADKRGVPGADWLAFRGLSFIRVAPIARQIATTGCSGGWKSGRFQWPLWDRPLTRDTVQVTLQLEGLEGMREAERRARGLAAVFSAAIRRSDQGGYGSFAPSTAV